MCSWSRWRTLAPISFGLQTCGNALYVDTRFLRALGHATSLSIMRKGLNLYWRSSAQVGVAYLKHMSIERRRHMKLNLSQRQALEQATIWQARKDGIRHSEAIPLARKVIHAYEQA